MIIFTILDHFVQGCDRNTATFEILGMLFVFFLLGFILRHVFGTSASKMRALEEENLNLKLNISTLEDEVNDWKLRASNFEKKNRELEHYQKEIKNSIIANSIVSKDPAATIVEIKNNEIEPRSEIVKDSIVEEKTNSIEIKIQEADPIINVQNSSNQIDEDLKDDVKELEKQKRIEIERARIDKELAEERAIELEARKKRFEFLNDDQKTDTTPVEKIVPSAEKPAEKKGKRSKVATKKDDLKTIEGIGPAIEKIMNDAGILSFDEMANYTEQELNDILAKAGSRFRVHDPQTWPEQAKLLSEGKLEEFKAFTDKLIAGKRI